MAHEHYEEAVVLYAVGVLEPQERQALETHLETGCPACRAALTEYQETAGLLPHALPPASAPSALKSQLMAAYRRDFTPSGAIRPEPSREPRQESFPRWLTLLAHPAFSLASVILLIGTAIYAVNMRSQVETEVAQRQHAETTLQEEAARLTTLQQQVAEHERALAGLREEFTTALGTRQALQETLARREREVAHLRLQVAQRDEILTFLRSPHVKVVPLAGLEKAKSAGALLLFDPDSKEAFFYAFNMPPLPAGKTYQLWAIVDKPVSAGTFDTDAGQKSRLLIRSIPDIARITKFAVSLEPEGGRPQPTGDLYLVGQL